MFWHFFPRKTLLDVAWRSLRIVFQNYLKFDFSLGLAELYNLYHRRLYGLMDEDLKMISSTKDLGITRDLKIEVFRHFPRTANVKKSRDQGLAVRFAVWGSRLYVKTTL